MIGHELSMELDSLLDIKSRPERTAVVLTRVLVDENDFAFVRPTKPVGPVLDKENKMINEWKVVETEKGLRRVVASPHPIEVLDLELISKLVDGYFDKAQSIAVVPINPEPPVIQIFISIMSSFFINTGKK